jgi:hypothetical protein
MAISSQSADRVIRDVHDEADQALRVKLTGPGGAIDVNVNASLDSIAIADADSGDKATVTDVGGGKKGLDVVVQDIALDADNDSISTRAQGLALRLDDTTTPSVTYVGEAVPGTGAGTSAWRIKRIDETSGLVISWADGNSNFYNNWNNRASLTYS